MQITPDTNIFNVVASEMVKTDRAECYLEVGERFEMVAPTELMQSAFKLAMAFDHEPAYKQLAKHFNTMKASQVSQVQFLQDYPLHGQIAVGDMPAFVSFSLCRVHDQPPRYRILFAQRAKQLPVEDIEMMRARLQELESRMTTLESQAEPTTAYSLNRDGSRCVVGSA